MTLIFDVWKDPYRACFWPFYGALLLLWGSRILLLLRYPYTLLFHSFHLTRFSSDVVGIAHTVTYSRYDIPRLVCY